jgi:hypothetical protein
MKRQHLVSLFLASVLVAGGIFMVFPRLIVDRPVFSYAEVASAVKSHIFESEVVSQEGGIVDFIADYAGDGKWTGSCQGYYKHVYYTKMCPTCTKNNPDILVEEFLLRSIEWNFYEESEMVELIEVKGESPSQ